MWKSIWTLITAPLLAIMTGKYFGFRVPRNPIEWLPLTLFSLLMIPVIIIGYPIFIFLTYLSYKSALKNGYNINIKKNGFDVYSKKKGKIAFYQWSDISRVVDYFNPPATYPLLILKNGVQVHLELADRKTLFNICKEKGIQIESNFPIS